MNEFSVICRILGTLFNRSPEDPVTKPLFELIIRDQLKLSWPLEQDGLLMQLATSSHDLTLVIKDFKQLFLDPTSAIASGISQYSEISATAVNKFLVANVGYRYQGKKADRFGALLLAASWLEDNAVQDPLLTQIQLLDQFILPVSELFFSQVETHAVSNFYPTLAMITREALVALSEELADS